MARPIKEKGIEYFSLDVTMDINIQLIEAEFGITGFGVIVKLYQEIYRQEGYYIEWTYDVAVLFASKNGVGVAVVSEIVKAAIRRGIFNKQLFDAYGVLTSRGIQKRYFDAVKKRTQIEVVCEYLLVDVAQICKSVNIKAIDSGKNHVNSTNNRQSIAKHSIAREGAYAPAPAKFKKPSIAEVAEYCSQENLQMDHTAFYDYYEMNGWVSKKGVTIEWKSACRNWERRGKEFAANADKRKFRQCVSAQTGESSLDKQELARLVHSQFLEDKNEN